MGFVLLDYVPCSMSSVEKYKLNVFDWLVI